ncbi:heterokaryon incompatibility protein-domain-containing protein [Cubamyces lactineus]|nr:heterokaryon incompatibility protein-domain-containing protein [Cubamyces lactineus]
MWLLNTHTAELRGFASSQDIPYAIISHVWQQEPKEQTFHEVRAIPALCKESGADPLSLLSRKIRDCCKIAARAGYDWLWLDTCCIDHHSSAELSEAINSMFAWYADAQVCYVYLHDVGDDEDPAKDGSAFRRSVWHTRGWTLQELLAPVCVIFLSKTWHTLGSKHSLAKALSQVSGIKEGVLMRERADWLESVSVAERMSWAAHRQTTRIEDRAYSLMGIFGINMPTIYGEGPRAFMRLQEEILQRIPDQSIFAWGRIHPNFKDAVEDMRHGAVVETEQPAPATDLAASDAQARQEDLLAPSPAEFAHSAAIKSVSILNFATKYGIRGQVSQYTLTSYGMLVELPVSQDWVLVGSSKPEGAAADAEAAEPKTEEPVGAGEAPALPEEPSTTSRRVCAAVLACEEHSQILLVLLLRLVGHASSAQYVVGEYITDPKSGERRYYRAALYPKFPLPSRARGENRTANVPFAAFGMRQVYIRHNYATLTLGEVRLRHAAQEQSPRRVVYTFHAPQWTLNQLQARHALAVYPIREDGLTLRVPYDVSSGKLEHAVSSAQLIDTARREIVIVRVGVGCACFDSTRNTASSPPDESTIAQLWIDARVAPVPERGHARPYGSPLRLGDSEWESDGHGPRAVRAPCGTGRVHLCSKGKSRDGELSGGSQALVAAFRMADREIRVRIEPLRGFEPVRGPVWSSYGIAFEVVDVVEDVDPQSPVVAGESSTAAPVAGPSSLPQQAQAQAASLMNDEEVVYAATVPVEASPSGSPNSLLSTFFSVFRKVKA